MQIEIIGKKGRTLRSINHGGQTYIEAPAQGEYKIRLRNTSGSRRLAIVSVDGVNVLDGKDAGFDGRGYVLRPWETIDVPGWMRSDSKVAKFEFKEQGGSYAAQTGRGTSNVGVIGVAVYDEKVQTYVPPHWTAYRSEYNSLRLTKSYGNINTNPEEHPRGMKTMGMIPGKEEKTSGGLFSECMEQPENYSCNTINVVQRPRGAETCSFDSSPVSLDYMNQEMERGTTKSVQDVGTGYGHEASFYTETTTFNRATTVPALVVSVRYATRERLVSWGVPLDQPQAPMAPNPFPSSMPSVPAPPGWRG